MIRCMGFMEEFQEDVEVCPYCGYQIGEKVKESYYLIPGTVLNGQYLVGKVLGYGGFGVTYVGWDQALNRKVAIKEYLPSDFATRVIGETKLTAFSGDAAEQFQTGLKRFLTEARQLAKFNNIPEIVDIYDCFYENDTGYIVMEFLYGSTVKEILAQGKAFSPDAALIIIKAVLHGLEAVHRAGIIHRDVAPDNIFLTRQNEVRLLDFGAARYAATSLSRSLSIILKPGYAPEEQYRSKGEQGPWTDVYGAGATLYRMITGHVPQESIERLMKDELPAPSELGITLPPGVENALMNALNVRRQDRIQSAEAFLKALENADTERVKATPIQKQASPARKPRWLPFVLTACAAVVFAGAGWLLYSRTGKELSKNEQSVLAESEYYMADITGLSYEDAQKALAENCSLVITGKNYSTTVPHNKIVSQTPEAGSIIKAGDEIQVVMSGGTEEVFMPDLESLTQGEAVDAIEAQGLTIDEEKDISSDYSDIVEKGRVYEQSVEADAKVTPGTEIKMAISLGKLEEETALLNVPDFTGKKKKAAIAELNALKEEHGFTYPLGKIQKEYSTEVKKGKIIRQDPAPGTKIRTNHAISLVISKGPKQVDIPDLVYMAKEEAVAALEALNLEVKTENVYSSSVASGSIVRQSIEAGTTVDEKSEITLSISIGPEPAPQPVYTEPSYNDYSGSSGGGSSGGSSGGWHVVR